MPLKKLIKSYYRSILVFLLVFFSSTIPAGEMHKYKLYHIQNIDKPVHLLMYFIFSLVLLYEISKSKPEFSKTKTVLIAASVSIAYGGLIEIFQSVATNHRSGDIYDFSFDIAGTTLAVLLWLYVRKSK